MTDMAAIVAAAFHTRGIGSNGSLAWRLPGDMAHFKRVTLQPVAESKTNVVIMGRKTWESIPPSFRPLSGRINIVLSSSFPNDNSTVEEGSNEGPWVASSWEQVEDLLTSPSLQPRIGNVFVIGGAQVYQQALERGLVQRVIYTQVHFPGGIEEENSRGFDSFFPHLNQDEWSCQDYPTFEENKLSDSSPLHTDPASGLQYRFVEYRRKDNKARVNTEELQYLQLCQDIIQNGVQRSDRTGTGTLSKFGTQMRFSLRDGTLPLLTTKRVFWRGVAEELLWFIQVGSLAFMIVSLCVQ